MKKLLFVALSFILVILVASCFTSKVSARKRALVSCGSKGGCIYYCTSPQNKEPGYTYVTSGSGACHNRTVKAYLDGEPFADDGTCSCSRRKGS
jgi:peptidoglycan hydrolase CwlO-like protein